MDTKLKRNKQIRAIIYRAISFGVLVMTILSATTGYKALTEVFANKHYQLFPTIRKASLVSILSLTQAERRERDHRRDTGLLPAWP